jgi:hypothetical protein
MGIGIVAIVGWFFHAKWQRKNLHGEIQRVSEEKTGLQLELLGPESIKSSK